MSRLQVAGSAAFARTSKFSKEYSAISRIAFCIYKPGSNTGAYMMGVRKKVKRVMESSPSHQHHQSKPESESHAKTTTTPVESEAGTTTMIDQTLNDHTLKFKGKGCKCRKTFGWLLFFLYQVALSGGCISCCISCCINCCISCCIS